MALPVCQLLTSVGKHNPMALGNVMVRVLLLLQPIRLVTATVARETLRRLMPAARPIRAVRAHSNATGVVAAPPVQPLPIRLVMATVALLSPMLAVKPTPVPFNVMAVARL